MSEATGCHRGGPTQIGSPRRAARRWPQPASGSCRIASARFLAKSSDSLPSVTVTGRTSTTGKGDAVTKVDLHVRPLADVVCVRHRRGAARLRGPLRRRLRPVARCLPGGREAAGDGRLLRMVVPVRGVAGPAKPRHNRRAAQAHRQTPASAQPLLAARRRSLRHRKRRRSMRDRAGRRTAPCDVRGGAEAVPHLSRHRHAATGVSAVQPRREVLRHGASKGSPPVPRRGRVRRLPVRREGARAHRRSCPRARCRSEDPTGVNHGSRLPLQGLRTRQRSREGIGDGAREVVERIAALDIGKAELVCCVRVPDVQAAGQRLQDVATYSTMTRSLLGMVDRLRQLGVTRVVMEALRTTGNRRSTRWRRPGSRPGWSTPRTPNTCQAGPRRTC